jgi:DNA-binding GntR family transcriptional regulator
MKGLELRDLNPISLNRTGVESKRSTMTTNVADVLSRNKVDGTLQPGTRISEDWVSQEMNVSRGPVREALRQLENEGLIVVHPFRGAVVNDISTEELRDVLIPLRLILESQACLRALPNLTEENFSALEKIVEDMRIAARREGEGNLLILVGLDVAFHEYLTELGNQYHTLHIWKLIQPRIRAGFFRLGSRHKDLMEIAIEHKDLVQALRTRDPKVALAALETHICTTQIDLLDSILGVKTKSA